MRWLRGRSLRFQLALLGFAVVVIPVVVLLSVVLVTEVEVESEGGSTVDGGGLVATESVSVETTGVSPWVPVTAALLATAAAGVVWWWAGRAVKPLDDIARAANEIQAGSLDWRIALTEAPTEVQALADSFDEMLARLETASAVQRELVENTSHELRTPLTVLAASADVMLANPEPTLDEYRACTERTRDAVSRLRASVDELLSEARATSHLQAQSDNDLVAIVERAADEHRLLVPGIPIVVRAPRQLRRGIDGASVGRAVGNLIDNAIKHSPDGGTVEINVGERGSSVLVSVTDSGSGIAPEDMAHIFDRYWTADTDPGVGHGIGLALVKQVADAHGGIEVESPLGPDGGSRFTLWFDA